ncbi:MAG: SRPBCC family protein [Bacteroidia bacterium]|nr:SRPBCC family protein [Bacteroidia bacterium]
MTTSITVKTIVNASIEKVWDCWSTPEHIKQWNNASPDWHTPAAENDLRAGGAFFFTMAAKDGSFSFDFGGTYDVVQLHEKIAYTIGDGRKVEVLFSSNGNETAITETFEAENMNPVEMQQAGWQAILDNFKRYTESV